MRIRSSATIRRHDEGKIVCPWPHVLLLFDGSRSEYIVQQRLRFIDGEVADVIPGYVAIRRVTDPMDRRGRRRPVLEHERPLRSEQALRLGQEVSSRRRRYTWCSTSHITIKSNELCSLRARSPAFSCRKVTRMGSPRKSRPTAGMMSIAVITAAGKVLASRSAIAPSLQPISSIRRGSGTHAAMIRANSSRSMNTRRYSSETGLSKGPKERRISGPMGTASRSQTSEYPTKSRPVYRSSGSGAMRLAFPSASTGTIPQAALASPELAESSEWI